MKSPPRPTARASTGHPLSSSVVTSICRDSRSDPSLFVFAHDAALTRHAISRLGEIAGIRVLGPRGERGAVAGFVAEWAHPHDLTTYANEYGIALRGGHHCNQPLMKKFRLPGTNRASFYFYNTRDDVDRMIDVLAKARTFFA